MTDDNAIRIVAAARQAGRGGARTGSVSVFIVPAESGGELRTSVAFEVALPG